MEKFGLCGHVLSVLLIYSHNGKKEVKDQKIHISKETYRLELTVWKEFVKDRCMSHVIVVPPIDFCCCYKPYSVCVQFQNPKTTPSGKM